MSEDDHIYWQDTLDAVMHGRTNDLKCPFCYVGIVEVIRLDNRKARLLCRNQQCNHFIEGRFGNDEDLNR
jgi:hypothetical protein